MELAKNEWLKCLHHLNEVGKERMIKMSTPVKQSWQRMNVKTKCLVFTNNSNKNHKSSISIWWKYLWTIHNVIIIPYTMDNIITKLKNK